MILFAEVECKLYEGNSLKDKRSVIKRLLSKLRRDFNVAITELDYHDLWQLTKIGIVTISTDLSHAEQIIKKTLLVIDSFPELERTITTIERI